MTVPPGPGDLLLWLMSASIPIMIFVWQPSEAGYLIPAVPFILLILARFASRSAFVLACIAVCASPFLGQFTPRVAHMVPSIPVYQAARVAEMRQVDSLWDFLAARPVRTMVITASAYAPKLMITQPEETKSRVKLMSWVTADDIMGERAKGGVVVCFAEACRWNIGRTGTDPITYGAEAFPGSQVMAQPEG